MAERVRVSDLEMANAIRECKSAQEVADKVGVKVGTVQARIGKWRKAGVNVPKFERKVRSTLDVNALNELFATE